MEISEKLNVLIRLAESHRRQFSQRRGIEWRIIFSVLGLNVSFSAAAMADSSSIEMEWYVIVGVVGLAIVTSIYLAYVHMANNSNKSIAENAEDSLINLLQDENPVIPDLCLFKKHWTSWKTLFSTKSSKWGWVWQSITLLMFAGATLLVISSSAGA